MCDYAMSAGVRVGWAGSQLVRLRGSRDVMVAEMTDEVRCVQRDRCSCYVMLMLEMHMGYMPMPFARHVPCAVCRRDRDPNVIGGD